jgi:large subunit ribosomal protein L25
MAVEALVLKAQIRNTGGSKHAMALREAGMIPAVVYGHKEKPVSIALNAHDFLVGLQHGLRLFDIQLDNKKEKLLIKEVQYDHLGKDILHADFMRVDLTERVKVAVPVELKGPAKGASEGGVIDHHLAQLEVECVVTNIPASISVSIKELGIGDSIKAGEIQLPEGVKLITDPVAIVLTCHLVAEVVAPVEAEIEAPTAPEVIGREKKEEEVEEGEGAPDAKGQKKE